MSRKEPTITAKLAAVVRQLLGIPFDHARLMTDDQVISLVQFNHILYHADMKDNPECDAHWNLEALTIMAHRERTRKIDVPQIAKTKRISAEHEAFRQRLLTPRDERPPKRSKWGSRPFPKRSKKDGRRQST
jgi:hypothetical protein